MPLNYWIPNRVKMLQDIEREKRETRGFQRPPWWQKPLEAYAKMQAPLWQAGAKAMGVRPPIPAISGYKSPETPTLATAPWELMGRALQVPTDVLQERELLQRKIMELRLMLPEATPERRTELERAIETYEKIIEARRGETWQEYGELPGWQKGLYEAPFWAATAGVAGPALGKIKALTRLPKIVQSLLGVEKLKPSPTQMKKYLPAARTLLGKAPPVAKIPKGAVARPDIADDIASRIKTWRQAVGGTKKLRGPEYTKRFQEYADLTDDFLKKNPGDIDGATRYAKSALRGKYPDATFDIPAFTKAEIDSLRLFGRNRIIETAKDYGRLGHRIGIDENNLDDALVRVFVDKKPPREFELKLFERAFGGEFTRTLANLRRTLGDKALSNFLDTANFPRAVLASFDVSAPARQGWILFARHPFKGLQSMKTMFRALRSEKNAQLIDDAIRQRPNTELGLKSGLELTRRAGVQRGVGLKAMAAREEAFMSRFAGKVPGIRMSERAYTTFLNDMRSRVWEGYMPLLQKLGADDATYRGMASLINMASGRGDLGRLRLMSPILNNMFFSPRLVLSRLQLPLQLLNRNPIVRKEAWKMFLSFMGLNTAIVSGLYLGGARVGLDPRSGEFGKVRIGNTRLDFWAGFAQFARFFTQFILAERKLQGGGVIAANRRQLLMRMAQSKFAPMMGFLWDLLEGQTYMGEDVLPKDKPEIARQIKNRLAPLFIQDMWDAIEDMGPEGIPLALPGAFGVGVITYKPSETRQTRGTQRGTREAR